MLNLNQLQQNFNLLPSSPGVYLFQDESGNTVYIGKARNLRDRVKSYFLNKDLGIKTINMIESSRNLDFIEVESEFEALLLEAALINKYKPKYNIALRDDKSPLYIVFTKEKFPRVRTARRTDLSMYDKDSIFGPFPNGSSVRSILKKLRRIFPFCESKGDAGRSCLHSHIGLCRPCPREIVKTNDKALANLYKKNINNLKKVLSGDTKKVINILDKEMNLMAAANNFENAAAIRDQINKLQWLTQPTTKTIEYMTNPNLLEDQANHSLESLKTNLKLNHTPARIECFDVSHTGKDKATSSMVVATNGRLNNREYRHFKIQNSNIPNDVAAIKETVTRRLKHKEWGIPDLIVIDGGKPQLNAAHAALMGREIHIISLAKKLEEIFVVNNPQPIRLALTDPGLQLLVKLRNESHRFARRLHHKLRSKALLS